MRRMGTKTSQLQIRVSPAEKAVLKRLAEAAGQSVSAYVLDQVLPSAALELRSALDRLSETGVDLGATMAELAEALEELPGPELARAVPEPDAALPPAVANRVAGLVESIAHDKNVVPPTWCQGVPPLPRPHFGWSLTSLKPHQLRVTPIPFKRRNVFFDPASRSAEVGGRARAPDQARHGLSEADDRMGLLAVELAIYDIEVEFYFIGGAVLFQAFSAAPPTASIRRMFSPAGPVADAILAVARACGVPERWPYDDVRDLFSHGPVAGSRDYVAMPHARVFAPLPEYVLAMKAAAMRLGDDFREEEDLRYVLRAMNVTSADEALAIVHAYFAERQLVPDLRERLQELLPS